MTTMKADKGHFNSYFKVYVSLRLFLQTYLSGFFLGCFFFFEQPEVKNKFFASLNMLENKPDQLSAITFYHVLGG